MLLQQPPEMRRSCLLLAFEEELEVDGRRDIAGAQRVQGGEHRDDRALVIARGSRIDARLAAHALAGRRKRNHFRPGRERPVAQHRCPRRARPLGGIDRLPVVVRVEHDVSRRAGSAQLAVDGRWPRSPSSVRAVTPRRRRISISAAALRRMLTLSDATLGIASRVANSRAISASCDSRNRRAAARTSAPDTARRAGDAGWAAASVAPSVSATINASGPSWPNAYVLHHASRKSSVVSRVRYPERSEATAVVCDPRRPATVQEPKFPDCHSG